MRFFIYSWHLYPNSHKLKNKYLKHYNLIGINDNKTSSILYKLQISLYLGIFNVISASFIVKKASNNFFYLFKVGN